MSIYGTRYSVQPLPPPPPPPPRGGYGQRKEGRGGLLRASARDMAMAIDSGKILGSGIGLFLVICGVLYFRGHHEKAPLETGYAANRQVIVWSTTAQVREQVATVNFGDRLQILGRFGDEVQVRTEAGITGWVGESDLLSSDFWKKTQDLEAEASKLPIEARGHTHVISNMHMDPARDSPRIRQLKRKTYR